jgi:hypothetical protein
VVLLVVGRSCPAARVGDVLVRFRVADHVTPASPIPAAAPTAALSRVRLATGRAISTACHAGSCGRPQVGGRVFTGGRGQLVGAPVGGCGRPRESNVVTRPDNTAMVAANTHRWRKLTRAAAGERGVPRITTNRATPNAPPT